MSRITGCINSQCPVRASCLRYRMSFTKDQPRTQYEYSSKTGCQYKMDMQGWNNTTIIPLKDADDRAKRNGG